MSLFWFPGKSAPTHPSGTVHKESASYKRVVRKKARLDKRLEPGNSKYDEGFKQVVKRVLDYMTDNWDRMRKCGNLSHNTGQDLTDFQRKAIKNHIHWELRSKGINKYQVRTYKDGYVSVDI